MSRTTDEVSPTTAVLEIVVLSSRADLVSGGDALIEIRLPKGNDPKRVRVELNGRDISAEFAVRPNGRIQGHVGGLREGVNYLAAAVSTNSGAILTITNHPRQGPMISGPQVTPYIWETEVYGLQPATSPDRAVPTRYDFFYKSTVTKRFEAYDVENPPPSTDVADTTTDEGHTTPYIVRRERGTLNRGIYDIAVLYRPGEDWQPWTPQDGWNGKLLMLFQGGGKPFHRQAGAAHPLLGIADVLSYLYLGDLPLSRGFAVATSSLMQVNELLSAETAIMLKELFIKAYGPVRYTIGFGGSGGAAMQHSLANNYPGVLNGLLPAHSIPDGWTLQVNDFLEFPLLHRYFSETSPHLWSDPSQRGAVDGTKQGLLCEVWGVKDRQGLLSMLNPRVGCTATTAEEEPDWVYDPSANPGGARGTLQDWQGQIFGYRPDGFANRPYDNSGVQYGLLALLRGQITPEQFVDLNAKIGGRDIDYNVTLQRSEADLEGLRHVYRSGLVNDCRQLDRVPIIDTRVNANNEFDYHATVHTQITRARLIAANGHANNQIRWVTPDPVRITSTDSGDHVFSGDSLLAMVEAAFLTLDRWLTAIEADGSNVSLPEKVLRHRPIEAIDTCWVDGKPGEGDGVPNYWLPRVMAGGPLTSDIFKCQLKPIDWNDYGSIQFTDVQKEQLQRAFPHGVADWTKPGVEQQPSAGVWQTFADAVGGRPLGPEPRSSPFRGAMANAGGQAARSSRANVQAATTTAQEKPIPEPAIQPDDASQVTRVPFE